MGLLERGLALLAGESKNIELPAVITEVDYDFLLEGQTGSLNLKQFAHNEAGEKVYKAQLDMAAYLLKLEELSEDEISTLEVFEQLGALLQLFSVEVALRYQINKDKITLFIRAADMLATEAIVEQITEEISDVIGLAAETEDFSPIFTELTSVDFDSY
ncbi:MAG: hypothetical protein FWE37_08275 [Spirochaetaceae bacterium]|nr:hypothetical protein [Spirochaetaceae bacterium]